MEAPRDSGHEETKLPPIQTRKLFIGGLSLSTKTEDLRDHFIKYGEITDVVVLVDPHTKKSRGFGFVTYATDEAVQRCLSENPHNVQGREVETKKAIPRTEKDDNESFSKSKKVFLGGLSLDATEAEVEAVAREFGEIEEIVIITEKETKKPRGFGFVIFKDYESADRMCKKRFMDIHNREVEAKRAISLDDMRRAENKARKDHDRVRGHVRDRGGYRSRDDDYGRDYYRSPPRYASYDYPRDYPPRDYSRSYSPPRYSGGYDDRPMYSRPPPNHQYDHGGYSSQASYGGGNASYGGYGGYNSGSGGYGGGSSGGYSSGLLPPPQPSAGYGGSYDDGMGAGYGNRSYQNSNPSRYHPYKR